MKVARAILFLTCSLVAPARRATAQEAQLAGTLAEGHTEAVFSVAFNPDGKTLASGGGDKTVRIWDVSTRKLTATLTGHQEKVSSVAFSPDGGILASVGRDEAIRLWDSRTGTEKATLKGDARTVSSVAFSPDGKLLASGGGNPTVQLWEAATGSRTGAFEDKDSPRQAFCVAFSPDGKMLAACGGQRLGWVGLWDTVSGKETKLYGGVQGVLSLSFSPDGKVLAVVSALTGRIELVDVTEGKYSAEPLDARSFFPSSVTFSPDGKWLASGGSDKTVRIWEVSTRKLTATLRGHADAITSVAFSPDGKLLASASVDKTIRLWDMPPR